jgi:lipopolysaccharide biosynthesis glycosyltransferase
MEAPLHVSIYSVLRNLHPLWNAKIYVLAPDVPPYSLARLRRTIKSADRPSTLVEITGCDCSVFSKLRPFHGSYAAYYRLLLPEYVTEDRFLYIDADTIPEIDVSPLFELDLQGHPMGVVYDVPIKSSFDADFYLSRGLDPNAPCFNSGVILFDRLQWLKQNCFSRLMEFARAHPHDLKSADQTVLNVVFARDRAELPEQFNVKLSTSRRLPIPERGIFHFVGSPKPWDMFGRIFHPYSYLWKRASRPVPLRPSERVPSLGFRNWQRLPNILGGYRRILRHRWAGR